MKIHGEISAPQQILPMLKNKAYSGKSTLKKRVLSTLQDCTQTSAFYVNATEGESGFDKYETKFSLQLSLSL